MDDLKVEITIAKKQIAVLLCSAFEGGSNYWVELVKKIEPVKWDFRSDEDDNNLQDYPLNEGGQIVLAEIDEEEDGDDYKHHILNYASLVSGICIMQSKYPDHFARIITGDDDAETGDVFLQCCLLGEIVYG